MVCGGDVDISSTHVDADEKQWQEMAEGCRAMEAARESVWLLIGLNGIHEGEAAVLRKENGADRMEDPGNSHRGDAHCIWNGGSGWDDSTIMSGFTVPERCIFSAEVMWRRLWFRF